MNNNKVHEEISRSFSTFSHDELVKSDKAKRSIKSLFTDFATATSAHGLQNVASSNSKIERAAWLLICIAALSMFSFMLTSLIQHYHNRPVSTSIEIRQEKVGRIIIQCSKKMSLWTRPAIFYFEWFLIGPQKLYFLVVLNRRCLTNSADKRRAVLIRSIPVKWTAKVLLRPCSHCSVFTMMRFCCIKSTRSRYSVLYKNGGKHIRICAFILICLIT